MNIKNITAKLDGPGKFVFNETVIDGINEDEVVMKIINSGICSSEVPFFTGKAKADPKAFIKYSKYPLELGHEISGRVIETGSKATRFKKGDYVTGITVYGSAFAEYFVEKEKNLIKIPDTVEPEYALGEPLACTINILRSLEPEIGDNVVIIGDGFMSLLMVQLLSKFPLKSLSVVGLIDKKLKLAKSFGAHNTILYNDKENLQNLHDNILEECGADSVIELAGTSSALDTAAWLVKSRRGKLVIPSFYPSSFEFNIGGYLMRKGPRLIPAHPAYSKDFFNDLQRAMWALENKIIDIKSLITHTFPFEKINEAFDFVSQKPRDYIKGIIKIG